MTQTPPRWDLTTIYPSLDDPRLEADLADIAAQTKKLTAFYETDLVPLAGSSTSVDLLSSRLNTLVDGLNTLNLKTYTLGAYLEGVTSTDSYNKLAEQLFSRFDIVMLPFHNLLVRLRGWLGSLGKDLKQALTIPGSAAEHAFVLLEEAEQSRYMMSEAEEMLANELTLSGGTAWGRLQGTLTSQKTVAFELEGETRTLVMPELINLGSHRSAEVRERAYQTEQKIWEEMKEPLAACLNGIKGETITLDKHRGRRDCLHGSLDLARIDQQTLDAMLSAMKDSLPNFRQYFKSKAAKLGVDALPWWSLSAPLGDDGRTYSFEEAKQVILTNFATFSPKLADFARRAFENSWIDAEQRPGKQGGAYCMEIPSLKESRIMCNFDGSFDQVVTIAHELGHGFHNHCAFEANKTSLQTRTPMTLAETASIMCETIVFNAMLAEAKNPQEELAILETNLSGAAGVIVDIYSRFLFEKEVFRRRAVSTLSADEISEVMEWAQLESYGDGLDPKALQKYMWTWKPHYYSVGLPFYNYPYAFGLLFGTGLYALYQQRGAEFLAQYEQLLASTGEAQAADLAARFGIDLRSKAFWSSSLDVFAKLIERYCAL